MKIPKILLLLAASSGVQSNELDNLLDASTEIVEQINTGIILTGAAIEYAYQGGQLSNGQLSQTAHISTAQMNAYNNALSDFAQNYQPYGNVQEVLEQHAQEALADMNQAVDVFTDVVVDMIAVVEIQEQVAEAETPDDQAEVQEYVSANQEALTITQEDVDTYNQSLDDIETSANEASAYLGVAANEDAVAFLQQGAENNNSDASLASVSYDANQQWVQMAWSGTNNATAVYINGNDFAMDFYVQEADILQAGSETLFYQTSPTYLGYDCFINGTDCEQ